MRVLFALLLLWPAIAAADYRRDYREGVIAAERQDWAKVESSMRRAIAEQPAPDPQARIRISGNSQVPYVPYFYLGLAAFSQGDCATAITLFEDSRHAGALKGLRESDRQAMMLRSCRAKLDNAGATSPGATPKPAALPVPTAPVAPAAPRQTATAPSPVLPATARPASAAPGPAAGTAPNFDTARAQSAQARLDRVDAALASSSRMLADAALADVRANGQRQLDTLTTQSRQARERLNAARQARDGAALNEVESALAALEAAGRELDAGLARQSLAAQVRPRLQPLADSFLRGDFERAAQWADEQSLRGVPQALAQALLLRAAARHELYVLGGERDLGQFDRIREDVRTARQVFAAVSLSEQTFSPRFRALFASTR